MRTNSLSLALASVVACSVIMLGASSASAANMNHVTAANTFISNAVVNDTDIDDSGCSINWATYVGHTKGACLFIEVLKHGNNYAADYVSTDIKAMWGSSSPTSAQLYAKISASPPVGGTAPSPETYFRQVTSIGSIQSGDVMVINSTSSYAGHTMIVRGAASLISTQLNPKWSGTLQWAVPIIDSTDSKHGCNPSYPDSRWYGDCNNGYQTGTGAGYGYVRIYTDLLTGQLLGYTWSVTSADSSTYYSPSTRPYKIARLTNLPAPIPPPPPPPPFGTSI